MLRFLRLPVATSAALISSFFFPLAGVTEENPICFMVTTSRQVVNLNSICGKKMEVNICQGPFDGEGLPVALSADLARLQIHIEQERQQGAEVDVGAELQAFMDHVPFPAQIQNIIKERELISQQLVQASGDHSNNPNFVKLAERYHTLTNQLKDDPCYSRIFNKMVRLLKNDNE